MSQPLSSPLQEPGSEKQKQMQMQKCCHVFQAGVIVIAEPSACLLALLGACGLGSLALGTLARQGTPKREVTLEIGVRGEPCCWMDPGLGHSSLMTIAKKP